MKTNIGGDRLGSGNKMNVHLRNYERSTHDLSYLWKSTMSVGTLVPFMSELALTGDSFDIKLDTHLMTIPTNGPLFGSFKVQLDVFTVPIRLYIKELHNNALNIGRDMSSIALPQVRLESTNREAPETGFFDFDNHQINSSSIFSYLNIRGLGVGDEKDSIFLRDFNALPLLSYYDIYKNYYANKQEEEGAFIHTPLFNQTLLPTTWSIDLEVGGTINVGGENVPDDNIWVFYEWINTTLDIPKFFEITFPSDPSDLLLDRFFWRFRFTDNSVVFINLGKPDQWPSWITGVLITVNDIKVSIDPSLFPLGSNSLESLKGYYDYNIPDISIKRFPLKDLDEMRDHLLCNSAVNITKSFQIEPYKSILSDNGVEVGGQDEWLSAKEFSQEGLCLKTYQSDLFNNWLSTEWLDGENGINELTRVQVNEDGFLLDDFNIMSKVYLMLNRIALSGGDYKSWLETVYSEKISNWNVESPVYVGGLIRELTFDEVISTVDTKDNPLGTLGGRGVMTNKRKGGFIKVRVDEPSYIIGIVSLTPRIDYSQGNKWDTNLKNMDDFHKPQLDGIGFQPLITDAMAWFDTRIDSTNQAIFKSAGKQPAWLNYMTNVNQTRGNFAIDGNQMWMTLNRKYDYNNLMGIQDLTTYIDPSKFNDVFAEGELDAQNFWAQIKVDIKARRKMSAKIIPNL